MKALLNLLYRRFGLVALGLLCVLDLPAAPLGEAVDEIVAIVNDDVVVRSELESQIDQLIAQQRDKAGRLPPRPVLEKQMLERLILHKLQLAAANTVGISAGDDLVGEAVGNIAKENGLTVSEFRKVLADEGVDFRAFREALREKIIINRLHAQEVMNRIVVTDQEVDALLAKENDAIDQRYAYWAFHIRIATPDGASPEQLAAAQSKAQRLAEALRAGADFKQTAMAESNSQKALEGGDLGWRRAAELPTLFVDALAKMERGDISDPIQSASGFHILKLEDYKGGSRHIITQTHARHILIRTNEVTSDEDAKQRLNQLRLRLEGGEDFATLARSHSDDKASAIKGGDLGWVSPGDLVPRFEEQMNNLDTDAFSQPFRTEFGWHIVQVLERRQHDNTEEVRKTRARNAIRERKFAEEVELFLRRLRDEAYVEIRLADS